MKQLRVIWRTIYGRLVTINIVWISVVVALAVAADLLSELPPGEEFIYPLRQFVYVFGNFLHVPVTLVLIVAIVAAWPLMIQWAIGRGSAVPEIVAPNIALVFLLIAVSGLGYTLFRTVDPPEHLDMLDRESRVYILQGREFPIAPTELYLYECDRYRFVCTPILNDASNGYSLRVTLDAEGDTIRILSNQSVIFDYTPR